MPDCFSRRLSSESAYHCGAGYRSPRLAGLSHERQAGIVMHMPEAKAQKKLSLSSETLRNLNDGRNSLASMPTLFPGCRA